MIAGICIEVREVVVTPSAAESDQSAIVVVDVPVSTPCAFASETAYVPVVDGPLSLVKVMVDPLTSTRAPLLVATSLPTLARGAAHQKQTGQVWPLRPQQ